MAITERTVLHVEINLQPKNRLGQDHPANSHNDHSQMT
jgi:hypothetical protein